MKSPYELVDEVLNAPVDLAGLLERVGEFIASYVVARPEAIVAMTLWTAHTHAFEAAETTPYLGVTSPEKQSGKTRTQEALERLVPRPIRTANISDAALFRSIADLEQGRATIMLDEADAIFSPGKRVNPREDLRALFNAGHTRGGSVQRCEGEGKKIRVVSFDVFGPKVLAAIGDLPDTIEDRCIPVRMRRKLPSEGVVRFRIRDAKARAEPIRRALAEWAAQAIEDLAEARPEIPDELNDRQQDGWEPLLAIADAAGRSWPAVARDAAIVLHAGGKRLSGGVELLGFIGQGFDDADADRLTSVQLCGRLNSIEEAPYGGWGKSGIEPRELARKLKAYGVAPRKIKLPGGSTAQGYHRGGFEDAWARYLTRPAPGTPTPSGTSGTSQVERHVSSGTTLFEDAEVPDGKGPLSRDVPEVPFNRGGPGPDDAANALGDDVCAAILDLGERFEEAHGQRPGAVQVLAHLRETRGEEHDLETVLAYMREVGWFDASEEEETG